MDRRTYPGAEALAFALGHLRVTQAEFASKLGMTQSYVSALLHGKCRPSVPVLLAIEYVYGFSREFIETGKGEMFAKSWRERRRARSRPEQRTETKVVISGRGQTWTAMLKGGEHSGDAYHLGVADGVLLIGRRQASEDEKE